MLALVVVLIQFQRLKRKQKGSIESTVAAFDQQPLPGRSHRDDAAKSNANLLFNQSPTYSENSGSRTLQGHDFSLASGPAARVPVRREYQSSHAHSTTLTRDELCAVRQMEIDQRLQTAQQEMHNLTSRQSGVGNGHRLGSSLSSEVRRQEMEHEMASMNEQIRQLETQIEQLQMERSSDWAQGFSDEPPPAYHSLS